MKKNVWLVQICLSLSLLCMSSVSSAVVGRVVTVGPAPVGPAPVAPGPVAPVGPAPIGPIGVRGPTLQFGRYTLGTEGVEGTPIADGGIVKMICTAEVWDANNPNDRIVLGQNISVNQSSPTTAFSTAQAAAIELEITALEKDSNAVTGVLCTQYSGGKEGYNADQAICPITMSVAECNNTMYNF